MAEAVSKKRVLFQRIAGYNEFDLVGHTSLGSSVIIIFELFCVNPECQCNLLQLRFCSLGKKPRYLFDLMLDQNNLKLIEKQIYDTTIDAETMIKDFFADDSFQGKIQEHIQLVNKKLRENPLGWLKIPSISPGQYVSYSEIYGPIHEEKFRFYFQEKEFLVEDSYCINMDCKDNNGLLFFKRDSNSQPLFFIRMDITSLEYTVNYRRLFFMKKKRFFAMVESFLDGIKDDSHLLRKRYKAIKRLGKHLQMKKKKEITIHTQIIGRNDPCICGSGKKLKKCCGK